MYNYPFEQTKYSGALLIYPAFDGWQSRCGIMCSASANSITGFHGFKHKGWGYGQQTTDIWTTLKKLNTGTVEFSFSIASTYNAGANQVEGSFSIKLWDNLIITSDSTSIQKQDGSRLTVISGYNARSYIGTSKTISVSASSTQLTLTINGAEFSATYPQLENLSENISFQVGCYGYLGNYDFAANTTLFAPGTITIKS